MVVEQLDIAGLKHHVETKLVALRQRLDVLHGLELLRCHAWNLGIPLRTLGVLATGAPEQPPLVVAEHRLGEIGLHAGGLLATQIDVHRCVQRLDEVGPPRDRRIVDGNRAGDAAFATRLPLAQAQQADDVALVAMKGQGGGRLVAADRRVFVPVAAGGAHMVEHAAGRILGREVTQVRADSRVDDLRLGIGPSMDREASHQGNAAACDEVIANARDPLRQHGEGKVRAHHGLRVHRAALRVRQR